MLLSASVRFGLLEEMSPNDNFDADIATLPMLQDANLCKQLFSSGWMTNVLHTTRPCRALAAGIGDSVLRRLIKKVCGIS